MGAGHHDMSRRRPATVEALQTAMLAWVQNQNDRGVFVTDASLRIRSWNQWLTDATGITPAEAVDQPLLELFPSFVERGIDQYYAEALSGQIKVLSQSLHRTIVPRRPGHDGDAMPQRGQIGPLVEGDQVIGTITILDDVTERLAAERELRARIATAEGARATAEAASRVKDEFLATLSHEIRTPLNAVLGWTRILRSRDFDRATVERAVEVIDRNASAQLTLISDMLDMARIAAGKVRLEVTDLDLTTLVLAAIDVVRPAADAKHVRLITDLAPRLPAIAGDRDRLLQVVWNLLSNAVKFTDPGGRVTVSVSATRGGIRLTVADTGHGIDPAFLPQVFERFKQADASSARRHGGLGLGLALVRELVELHGGSALAESAGPGHGSTFTVLLPSRTAVPATAPSPSDTADTAGALGGVRVLVVEDDADARDIIVQTLSDAGAIITAVSAAADALAAVAQHPTGIDVVLTDIGMPGADGYTLLRELRKLPPESGGRVPAIAVTAYATSEDRHHALKAGFVAHIGKPFAPLTLISTIARAAGTAA
jgi:PAS domain S-box-containing protein